MGRIFSQHHPDENLELVKFALQARSQGHHAGVVAMMAFSRLVLDHRALIQRRLLPAAVVQNTTAVLELVVQRGPLKSVEVSSVRVPRIMPDRDLTLGERRTLARSADRNVLTRLLTDPDPGVISILLGNPKVLERDVLRIASGQPNLAEVLSEVFAKRPLVSAPEHSAGVTPKPLHAERFIEKSARADGRDRPSEGVAGALYRRDHS